MMAVLAQAIHAFAASHPETLDPLAVAGRCTTYTLEFLSICAVYAVDGEAIWAEDEGRSHAVARVGSLAIDWTYRQYDPDAAVPAIWTGPPFGRWVDMDGNPTTLVGTDQTDSHEFPGSCRGSPAYRCGGRAARKSG